jgi:hypothetical protein
MRIKITALAVLAAATFAAHATTLTFDDVQTGDLNIDEVQLAPGYAGLGWSNVWVLNARSYWIPNSGYSHDIVSNDNVAYNGYANPAEIYSLSSTGFGLHDGYFGAAWNDGLQITADAVFVDGSTATRTFTVDTSGSTDEVFGWNNLASVTFSSMGGTPHDGLAGAGAHFAMDNLTVTSAVPEPTGASLVMVGLALLGAIARRRKAR